MRIIVAISIILFSGIPANVLRIKIADLRYNRRAKRFQRKFGCIHDGNIEEADKRTIERMLKRKSETFHSACCKQERIRSEVKRLHSDMASLVAADKTIEKAKQAFWQAHALAKRFDYPLEESSYAYLPNKRTLTHGGYAA
jgi:hypothetical protein